MNETLRLLLESWMVGLAVALFALAALNTRVAFQRNVAWRESYKLLTQVAFCVAAATACVLALVKITGVSP